VSRREPHPLAEKQAVSSPYLPCIRLQYRKKSEGASRQERRLPCQNLTTRSQQCLKINHEILQLQRSANHWRANQSTPQVRAFMREVLVVSRILTKSLERRVCRCRDRYFDLLDGSCIACWMTLLAPFERGHELLDIGAGQGRNCF
jgi:hypothetical protein